MDRKSVSAIVLILAAGIFYPRQTSRSAPAASGTPAPVTAPSTSAKVAAPAVEGPWKPICDHFRRASPSQSPQTPYCLQLPEAKGVTFRTMIVLAPDPELTHLALDFDRTMESTVWAVADGGFQLESYWFPWQKPPDKEETDPDKRKSLKQDQDERLTVPGLLLFRETDAKKSDLLAVFVVGDRPDFGPSRIQFQAALDGISVLPGSQEPISVVGPSFSGSVAPLGKLIQDNSPRKFFVATGRTTNRKAVEEFSQNDTSPRSLCSTIENDETALDGFGRFAGDSQLQLGGQVAILNEDETTTYADTEYSKRLGKTVQFRFPRGISRLRNSVEELPGLTASAPNNSTGYQALPLILKEPGQDTLRSFSDQLTPVSSEAVMLNIAVSLRRMQIHYAGILATDPLDALFLARFLRIAAPDIRLFFLQSDVLFAREAHNSNLEGVITTTTYPLILENQYGDYPKSKISFASAYEEATYNACRRVMLRWTYTSSAHTCDTQNGEFIEYRPPFPRESREPNAPRTPALWLTILGHDSFWPVALLDHRGTTLLKGPSPADPDKSFNTGPEPFIWRVLFLGLMGLNLFHLIFIGLNVRPFRDHTFFKAIVRYDPIRNFRIRQGSPYIGGQAANIAIMYLSLALVNAIFLIAAVTFQWGERWPCAVFLTIFVLVAIWMTSKAIWRAIRHRENWSGAPLLAALPWVFTLASVRFLLPLWQRPETSHASFFFVYRSVHLDNGVSPAAPLLAFATGFYYWAWIQTRRFRLGDELRLEMPQTVIAPKNFMGEIDGVFGKKASFLFGLLTLIFFLLFCPFIYVHTVEGRGYDYLIAMALLAIYAMLIGSLVRFSILWRDLRTILQFLERHPLRDAFTRLPHTFSWTSIWQGDLKPTFVTTGRSRDCLRRLIPYFNEIVDQHLEDIQKGQANNIFQFQPSYYFHFRRLEHIFKFAADEIADWLQPRWIDGSSDSIEEAKKPSLDPERTSAPTEQDELVWFAEEFLALQYVTLIRYGFFQMRNFLEFVTGGFILMVMAVYVYPFEDHLLLGAANITMFALLAVGMLMAFAQMDRDPVLSRLSSTKPKLDMNFVWRVVSYGSLPLLALLGSQFPTVGNFLFSWVQPALQTMK